jgi:predicted lipoprotein with Yx(FWY)xxD motif
MQINSGSMGVLAAIGVAAALGTSAVALGAVDSAQVPYVTPPGITLVDAMAASEISRGARFVGRRLSDASGTPLYTYDKDGTAGKPTCLGECAKEFPPFLAEQRAIVPRDWSLARRPEGRQWVFRGQPLYGYAGSTRFSGKANPGWKVAFYDPSKFVPTPANIRVQSLEQADGYGFVVVATGMPTYILPGGPKTPSVWMPVYASDIALPVGDFTSVKSTDGTRQWAYKGQRLYTYSGDYSSTDINGLTAQKDAEVALAYRFFKPASIAINVFPMRPPMMTTALGLSLYAETPYHLQYGGRETRGGYHILYAEAKSVGTMGCVDTCTKTWIPLAAPAGAQPWGFWEIYTRADGSKQWAYKGSALYTYAGDKAKGDINGNNRDTLVWGAVDGSNDALVALAGGGQGDSQARVFGAGFYWHLVPLF